MVVVVVGVVAVVEQGIHLQQMHEEGVEVAVVAAWLVDASVVQALEAVAPNC